VRRAVLVLLAAGVARAAAGAGLSSQDLYRLQSVSEVAISPDGRQIAYTVRASDRPGAPYTRAFVVDRRGGAPRRLDEDGKPAAGGLAWSPDGAWLAYRGEAPEGYGLVVSRPDGSERRRVASLRHTNHPLPWTGEGLSWSPDARRLAFVSAVGPDPEPADPVVITRYLYKPHSAGGSPPFNDGRRLQLFVADVRTGTVRALAESPYHDHSPSWSPRGEEVAFLSNRSADPDRVFNYDVLVVSVADGAVRRVTETPSAEYAPAWSPDGSQLGYLATRRPLTSSETTMEDTHVWRVAANGQGALELAGGIDNRQGPPRWSADGKWLYFTVQERGDVRLYRLPAAGGPAEAVAPAAGVPGAVGDWSLADDGTVAYALATAEGPAELMVKDATGSHALTRLNAELLGGRERARVESFRFAAEGGLEIESFLTLPLGRTGTSRHPLIAVLHGGPHGQQGPAWNTKAQVYAARGWATLMVNYRGSTGYGQKLTDAIFADQDGAEARDCLAALDEALRRYPWLDRERLGVEGVSYGGQLANWIVTQTDRFKAAVPLSGISNLVSFNYMAYYHDYLAVEYGAYPHQGGLMDRLWERSPLRLVARVKTPVLFLHGENDNDVPIAEAEQFYIALQDVGVPTVLVRYPREGHGLYETGHVVDALDRSIAWYDRWFAQDHRP
jgi:dipeptidyl aminopeptidase/acylaminoacyl peptidase